MRNKVMRHAMSVRRNISRHPISFIQFTKIFTALPQLSPRQASSRAHLDFEGYVFADVPAGVWLALDLNSKFNANNKLFQTFSVSSKFTSPQLKLAGGRKLIVRACVRLSSLVVEKFLYFVRWQFDPYLSPGSRQAVASVSACSLPGCSSRDQRQRNSSCPSATWAVRTWSTTRSCGRMRSGSWAPSRSASPGSTNPRSWTPCCTPSAGDTLPTMSNLNSLMWASFLSFLFSSVGDVLWILLYSFWITLLFSWLARSSSEPSSQNFRTTGRQRWRMPGCACSSSLLWSCRKPWSHDAIDHSKQKKLQ